jgi:hypothetical protein
MRRVLSILLALLEKGSDAELNAGIPKGAVALKRVTASFLCLKHKNRTSKSAVFAVKYIYATK